MLCLHRVRTHSSKQSLAEYYRFINSTNLGTDSLEVWLVHPEMKKKIFSCLRISRNWKLNILKSLRVNLISLLLKSKWKTCICSRVLSPLYQCRSQPKKEKGHQRPSWRQAPRQVWWTSTYTSMIDKNLDKYQRRSQDTIIKTSKAPRQVLMNVPRGRHEDKYLSKYYHPNAPHIAGSPGLLMGDHLWHCPSLLILHWVCLCLCFENTRLTSGLMNSMVPTKPNLNLNGINEFLKVQMEEN